MPGIEERAEKWAHDYVSEHAYGIVGFGYQDLVNAYLAGAAQTQKDYTAHDNGK